MLKKLLIWIPLCLVGLVLLLALGLFLFFPAEKVRTLASEKGSEMLGRPVTIGSVDWSLWGGFGVLLKEVTIGNPPGWEKEVLLSTEKVELKLKLLPLLSGRYEVGQLLLVAPVVDMSKRSDGTNNFSFTLADSALIDSVSGAGSPIPSEAAPAGALVAFDRVVVVDGALSYRDDSLGRQVHLSGIELETSLNTPGETLYRSQGRIAIDTVRITIQEPLPPVSASVQYDATYDLTAKTLSLNECRAKVNQFSIELGGQLDFDAPGPSGSLTAQTGNLQVSDLLSLLSPGQRAMLADYQVDGAFSASVEATLLPVDDSLDVSYRGSATISGMSLASQKVPGTLKLNSAEATFKTDTARLRLIDGSFNNEPLSGQILIEGFSTPKLSGQLAGKLDLAYLTPFLPSAQGHSMSGPVSFDITFSGSATEPEKGEIAGSLEVTDATYASLLTPEPLTDLDMICRFDQQTLTITQLSATSSSASTSFSGRVSNLFAFLLADSTASHIPDPQVDGRLQLKSDLSLANRYLPEKGAPRLTGKMAMDLRLIGSLLRVESFRPSGRVSIADASYTDSLLPEPVKRLDLSLRLAPDTVYIDTMRLAFVSSDASLTGKLSRPFPYLLPLRSLDRSKMTKPLLEFSLSSRRFDTDKLFPEAVPAAKDSVESSHASAPPASGQPSGGVSMAVDSVSMILLPDIDGRGTVSFDTLVYNKVDITSVRGTVKIYNRTIDISDVAGDVYSGKLTGATRVDFTDFSRPAYSGDFHATQVEADDFITRFTPLTGVLFGKMEMKGSYGGSGWEPEDFLNSLTLNGQGGVQSGKLVLSGEVYEVVKSLGAKFGETIDAEQTLRALATQVKVQDGKVQISNLKTTVGGLGDLEIGGYYDFSGNIAYTGSIYLSRELSAKALAQLGSQLGIGGSSGNTRIKLPLKISGTVTKPEFGVDTEGIGKNLGENLKGKADEFLKGLLKK